MEPRILNFRPDPTINDRATAARKAARLVRGDPEATDDPTCGNHAITNIFEEGHKAIEGVVREMMNIMDEMAARVPEAKKQKAMRASVGWFSSPSCALIYPCAKYVALRSSKGYAIGAKFWQWLDAEQYIKEDTLDGTLHGSVDDMFALAGATRSSSSTQQ
eukprot:6196047-Pleurochrysis_carterae.AAC.4